ncbi:HD-GYP domain-containing protein [Desulforamulus ruminis]|uniref:Metal-dependent phosphohydrolase HD sub domain protein n=1 Tax=Desulforamulus ruminis (strain ATCC 23193 / DSM 2154 / NCIMB 8452 / DL) TaxID=696281 RepID=F6DQ06_DESRL|nr:HD domain-containing phosphohydrolase [Desulforamulus ruminis]AEG61950.1 metal-dependent phosphohydrolase HD sub domain protein [Desulforamulus ruminis DSM 2154]
MKNLYWAEKLMRPIPVLHKHAEQTMELAIRTAIIMSFDKRRVAYVGIAAFLHDLGKTTWPKELFYKTPVLPHEWDVIKDHTIQGEKIILSKWPNVSRDILRLVSQHHERPGGLGYPNGIYDPPLDVLVLAACDVYNAMVTKREYRNTIKEFAPEVALLEIAKFAPEQVVGALARAETLRKLEEAEEKQRSSFLQSMQF